MNQSGRHRDARRPGGSREHPRSAPRGPRSSRMAARAGATLAAAAATAVAASAAAAILPGGSGEITCSFALATRAWSMPCRKIRHSPCRPALPP